MKQNYTWADLVKGETRNLHNNIEGRHSMVQSIEPQTIVVESIPMNKQVIQPNVASKMSKLKVIKYVNYMELYIITFFFRIKCSLIHMIKSEHRLVGLG